MERLRFKRGDWVSWVSQANSGYKRKTGRVVAVVPAFEIFDGRSMGAVSPKTHRWMFSPNEGVRDHESYIVEVDTGPRSKKRLYHPVVSKLKPAGARKLETA